jgi:hypothetical protein
VVGRGYAVQDRWRVVFSDGGSAFVKAAVSDDTAGFLRDEYRVYSAVREDFLPQLLGWEDEGSRPVLVLEDLTGSVWPPPWTRADVDAVLATLERVAATTPPAGTPLLEDTRASISGWHGVADDPRAFLELDVCTSDWLRAALPTLLHASEAAALEGDALLHFDVRSDNLCLRAGRAVLFDWNLARVGNPRFDIAFWLPSLVLEDGCRRPEDVIDDEPELAALVAGFFAVRAGLPPPAGAPTVRAFQLAQLEVALPWAIRSLELPPTH